MKRYIKKFAADRSGNFGMMTALVMVPLLATVGMALDFARALEQRSALLAAADAAAVGALSTQSPAVKTALASSSNGEIKLGAEDARSLFSAHLPEEEGDPEQEMLTGLDISVTRNASNLKSQVSFTASVPTTFLRLINQNSITISGAAEAVFDAGGFMDFYLLLDNTPSMGVGATLTDIATMERNTPDSCAFACHDLSNKNNYYNLAKSLKVEMRIDVVRQATQRLTYTAEDSKRFPDQFRMAVYTFGSAATNAGLTQVSTLSSDMAKVRSSAAAIDLMTIPYQNYNNDQTTDLDLAFSQVKQTIKTGGTGNSAADPQKILFFVSDGLTDSGKGVKCTKPTTNSTRCQEPIDASICKPLKDAGIQVAVLYTTYLPLPKNAWYNSWIKPFQSQIGTRMEACASPGLYFEVSPSEGIEQAMEALFKKIVRAPRISS